MPLRTTHRLRFRESDRAGMIFHGHFVTWFQDAFEDLMTQAGHPERHLEAALGVRVPVVHLSIDFRRHPADDEVVVAIEPVKLGASSVTFRLAVEDDEGLCAEAEVVRVCIDVDGRSVDIPDALREAWGQQMSSPS